MEENKELLLSYISNLDFDGIDALCKDFGLIETNEPKILMTSQEIHQIAMFDKIEKALSERPFNDDELDFILKAIKNSKSYVVVFS